jgi:serine/threonine protein kinase
MLGTKIAHYVVETELGRGGMGVVYRAKDLQLGRTVALKLLSEEYVKHHEQRQMILAEARIAAALNHPGVTTIYEVGEHEGRLFIAMEPVAGKTMRALLQEGAFEPRRLIRFATQIAEALEAVHSHGVRHGDVKPENITPTTGSNYSISALLVASPKWSLPLPQGTPPIIGPQTAARRALWLTWRRNCSAANAPMGAPISSRSA